MHQLSIRSVVIDTIRPAFRYLNKFQLYPLCGRDTVSSHDIKQSGAIPSSRNLRWISGGRHVVHALHDHSNFVLSTVTIVAGLSIMI